MYNHFGSRLSDQFFKLEINGESKWSLLGPHATVTVKTVFLSHLAWSTENSLSS